LCIHTSLMIENGVYLNTADKYLTHTQMQQCLFPSSSLATKDGIQLEHMVEKY
jgi:hypothetical protein